MTPEEVQAAIEQFTQDVYLTRNNKLIANISSTTGQSEVAKTTRFLNMYLDELEMETDSNGQQIDWNFVRNRDSDLGEVLSPSQTFELPDGIRRLVFNTDRPLVIMQGDVIVSRWDVVDPNQITKRVIDTDEKVTVVRDTIVFSRPLKEYELNGHVIADTISDIPRVTDTDASVFSIVEPYQLLVLGVAKNATLPDIVQGTLSPSFAQKYADLLEQTKLQNDMSSEADLTVYDDYSSIGGIF